jgi:hypothetical protein
MVFSFVAEVTALINEHVGKGWHGPFIVKSEFAAASYSKVFIAIDNKAASCAYYFLVLACSPTRLSFKMRQAKIQQGVI